MLARAFTLLIMIVAGAAAEAQIYRCELDGTLTFSDTPCSADAVSYAPTGSVSVVPTASDLDQIAAANQAFIQARLDRQSAERKARQLREQRRQAAAEAPPRPHQSSSVIIVPRQARGHRHHPRRGSPTEEQESRQQPFSALSGPWPGSRRRSGSDP